MSNVAPRCTNSGSDPRLRRATTARSSHLTLIPVPSKSQKTHCQRLTNSSLARPTHRFGSFASATAECIASAGTSRRRAHITNRVNADREALIHLAVGAPDSQEQQVEAAIDTGFSGYLTLPSAAIGLLNLVWLGLEEGILADGSVDDFDVYRASVIWDSKSRNIEVQAVNAQPLAGMALLHGHSLRIDVVTGGVVTITALQ